MGSNGKNFLGNNNMGSNGKDLLGNNYMRSGSKDGNGGNDGEGGEGDEAQSIQHLQDCSHNQLHISLHNRNVCHTLETLNYMIIFCCQYGWDDSR